MGTLKEYTAGSAMMAVSVGSQGGAGQMFGFVMGVSFQFSSSFLLFFSSA